MREAIEFMTELVILSFLITIFGAVVVGVVSAALVILGSILEARR